MIILPFTHVSKKGSFGTLHSFKLFLANGGKEFWKTEEDISEDNSEDNSIETLVAEYLEPNGFFKGNIKYKDKIFLVELPPSFDTSSFYSWGEAEDVDLWRTFFWIETDNEKGWTKQADSLKIENFSLTQIWKLISAEKV